MFFCSTPSTYQFDKDLERCNAEGVFSISYLSTFPTLSTFNRVAGVDDVVIKMIYRLNKLILLLIKNLVELS